MKIIFVYPRTYGEYMLFPPLGLLYLTSILIKEGHSPKIIDCNLLDDVELVKEIKDSELVGIYVSADVHVEALRIAELSKRYGKTVVFGGPQASALPCELLNCLDVDIIVVGEGEETLIELVDSIGNNKSLKDVNGIAFRSCGKVVLTERRDFITDLDRIPFPRLDLLDMDKYFDKWRKNYGYTVVQMISSRGCPYNCIYCSKQTFGNVYRARSPTNVVDEMEQIANDYLPDLIVIQDDFFMFDKERTITICKEILDRDLNVDWVCTGRVDMVDEEVLGWMKKAGCGMINFGVESGSERMLKYLNKQTNITQIVNAFKITRESGIKRGCFIIIGIPGETEKDIRDTETLLKMIRPDWMNISYFTPLPGSRAWDELVDSKTKDHYSKTDLDFRSFSESLNFSDLSRKQLVKARSRMRKDFFIHVLVYNLLSILHNPSLLSVHINRVKTFLYYSRGFNLVNFVKRNVSWFHND